MIALRHNTDTENTLDFPLEERDVVDTLLHELAHVYRGRKPDGTSYRHDDNFWEISAEMAVQ